MAYARVMRRPILAWLLAVGMAGACDSNTFVDDGGTDATDDVPPVGGGDGGADATTNDAAQEAAPKPRFCETVDAQFCADFDVPNDSGAGFTQPPMTSGGWTTTYEDAQVVSAPLAFASEFQSDAGGVAFMQNAALSNALVTSKMSLDLDVFLPNNLTTNNQPLWVFRFGVLPDPNFTFGLAHEAVWKLERSSIQNGPTLSPQPATGEWAHVTLTIDLPTNVVEIHVLTSAGDSTIPFGAPTAPDGGTVFPGFVSIGAETPTPLVSSSVLYDNVVIRWQ